MLKKYFYKTALTTAALSTAVSVLLAGCGQSAGTGTAKTNTVTSAVSGQIDIRSSSNSDSGSTADSAGTSGADSSSAATSYTITDEEIAAAYANTDNSYDAMYLSRQPGNPAGTYETVHYYSTTAGTTRQACVMLPTEYDPSKIIRWFIFCTDWAAMMKHGKTWAQTALQKICTFIRTYRR